MIRAIRWLIRNYVCYVLQIAVNLAGKSATEMRYARAPEELTTANVNQDSMATAKYVKVRDPYIGTVCYREHKPL